MGLTSVGYMQQQYLRALRATVAHAMPNLNWRHAGLGMLQAYLYEGTTNEMRVHIWHPNLKKPGMFDHGDIHDHRFDLRSYVLAGMVTQEEFLFQENYGGNGWRCHIVTHAREAAQKTGTHHEVKDGEVYGETSLHRVVWISAGQVYTFPKRAFHRSSVDGLTVTLVEKYNQDEVPARILSLRYSPIVHAFTDVQEGVALRPYIEQAQQNLLHLAKT